MLTDASHDVIIERLCGGMFLSATGLFMEHLIFQRSGADFCIIYIGKVYILFFKRISGSYFLSFLPAE